MGMGFGARGSRRPGEPGVGVRRVRVCRIRADARGSRARLPRSIGGENIRQNRVTSQPQADDASKSGGRHDRRRRLAAGFPRPVHRDGRGGVRIDLVSGRGDRNRRDVAAGVGGTNRRVRFGSVDRECGVWSGDLDGRRFRRGRRGADVRDAAFAADVPVRVDARAVVCRDGSRVYQRRRKAGDVCVVVRSRRARGVGGRGVGGVHGGARGFLRVRAPRVRDAGEGLDVVQRAPALDAGCVGGGFVASCARGGPRDAHGLRGCGGAGVEGGGARLRALVAARGGGGDGASAAGGGAAAAWSARGVFSGTSRAGVDDGRDVGSKELRGSDAGKPKAE